MDPSVGGIQQVDEEETAEESGGSRQQNSLGRPFGNIRQRRRIDFLRKSQIVGDRETGHTTTAFQHRRDSVLL
ncbi:hypothetical protein [Streptomyces sp. BK208]|uniref:hypothetical protein n=1 Tax=Streptomyces sp. BK208 TaxID=2512150 RepID=UPI001FB8A099|nr:hypothetical protein [Streptomyces sp. BK208]